MTNYTIGFTNNTNARKDKGGARHRALLGERRADREIEDAANVVNKLQETISEVEKAKQEKEGSTNDELKQLNKEVRDERRKVARLEEQLEDKIQQITKLQASAAPTEAKSTVDTTVLNQLKLDLKTANARISTLAVKIESLTEENQIITSTVNLLRDEKATLEKAMNWDFSQMGMSLDDATLIVDRKYEQTIAVMEDRIVKLEVDRDNLAGTLKAAQLNQSNSANANATTSSPSTSAVVGSDKLYEILDSILDPTRRNKGGDVAERMSGIVEELKVLRDSAKRNAVKAELGGRSASAGKFGDSRDRKIQTLNDSLGEAKEEINLLNEKVVVKVAKIKKLRGDIVTQATQISELKAAAKIQLETPPASNSAGENLEATRIYDELFESLALEKKKSDLLETRLSGVEKERDEARLTSLTLRNRNLSDAGDDRSVSNSQNISTSNAVSSKAAETIKKMAANIAALSKTVAELRDENTELLLASVGI